MEKVVLTRTDEAHRGGYATAGAGEILALILSGRAPSRAALERASGLSRATIAQRLSVLFSAGLLYEADETLPSGGRPARVLKLKTNFAAVIAADIGESFLRVALTDLEPRVLAETTSPIDVGSGPAPILAEIARAARALLAGTVMPARRVLGVGLSLPAPVDYGAGRVVGPSVMRAWDDIDIRGVLTEELALDVFADNDVNLMALSEHRRFWPGVDDCLFIKAGTGIGSGIVMDGRIYRGARGAAGDIGHIQLTTEGAPLCRCGKLGCVEARGAGWAIARDLRARGFQAANARDVIALIERNTPECIQLVREAGRVLGEVAADVVSVLNPNLIIIGGTLARAEEHLLAGVRELVYQRCLPLATRELQISPARSDDRAGVLGAAQLVVDAQLAPNSVERTIARALGTEPEGLVHPA
jgi:predicted NBD/HSP70 family sugar kinase